MGFIYFMAYFLLLAITLGSAIITIMSIAGLTAELIRNVRLALIKRKISIKLVRAKSF